VGVRLAPEQSRSFEAIDLARQATAAEGDGVGQLAQAQTVIRGVDQLDQDVVPPQRRQPSRVEVALDPGDRGGVGADEGPPGVEAVRREIVGRDAG
jgi:hypothetical protein